jgi:hypothetical protein
MVKAIVTSSGIGGRCVANRRGRIFCGVLGEGASS